MKFIIKYSWYHTFTAIIWCDNCHHSFKLGEDMYKKPKKVDGLIVYYYYCMKCAKEKGYV